MFPNLQIAVILKFAPTTIKLKELIRSDQISSAVNEEELIIPDGLSSLWNKFVFHNLLQLCQHLHLLLGLC